MYAVIPQETLHRVAGAIARRHPWVDVRDLYQEAYIAAILAIDKFDPDKSDNLKSYICTVVANACKAYAWQCYGPTAAPRNGSRQSSVAKTKTISISDIDEDEPTKKFQAGDFEVRNCYGEIIDSCTQEAELAAARARSVLRFALVHVTDSEMAAAVLYEDVTVSEAAEIYGVSKQYVRDCVQNAKEFIRSDNQCYQAYKDLSNMELTIYSVEPSRWSTAYFKFSATQWAAVLVQ